MKYIDFKIVDGGICHERNLDILASVMLLPDDEDAQATWLWRLTLDREAGVSTGRTRHEVAETLRAIKDERSLELEDLAGRMEVRNGLIAGGLLHTLVNSEGQVRLETIKSDLAKTFSRAGKRIDTKTISNDVWKRYRRVSPFWAANIHLLMEGTAEENASWGFPCPAEHLPHLLVLADLYRQMGERAQTKQASRPLLRPGETLLLPPWLYEQVRTRQPANPLILQQ